jgi:hypothetical protein
LSLRARLQSGDGDVRANVGGSVPWIVTFEGEKNGTRTFHDGVAALFSAAGATDMPRGWRHPFLRQSDIVFENDEQVEPSDLPFLKAVWRDEWEREQERNGAARPAGSAPVYRPLDEDRVTFLDERLGDGKVIKRSDLPSLKEMCRAEWTREQDEKRQAGESGPEQHRAP